jgi:hypothetical protein
MRWKDPDVWIDDINPLIRESIAQIKQWGIQTHSPFEWLTYAAEELGELAKAISEHVYRQAPASDVSKEAIQLATLALKIAKMSQEVRKNEP